MEKDILFNFSKGDLLILHLDEHASKQFLVIHVVEKKQVFYCWDREEQVYRLIHSQAGLHMLCPQFDPHFPSDIDWTNEWVLELYLRKYRIPTESDTN